MLDGVLYHGDFDGVVGASVLLVVGALTPRLARWVATEDYDFRGACRWIGETQLRSLATVDLGIENNPAALGAIAANVDGPVFIFDHHVVTVEPRWPPNVILANPTPDGHSLRRPPVPAFLFADELLRGRDTALPSWLMLAAIFAEGVDEFFPDDVERLLAESCGQLPTPTAREAFRRTELARISVLMRAAFADSTTDDHRVVERLSQVMGEGESADSFLRWLDREFAPSAAELSKAISDAVEFQLRSPPAGPGAVFTTVDSRFPIAGPVASILRGRLGRTVVALQERGDRLSIELRAPNTGPADLPSVLAAIEARGNVRLLHHGGHRTAAGAAVDVRDTIRFVSEFRATFVDGAR